MPSVAPLFLQDAQFSSTLYLVNEGNSSVTGRLLLLAQDGTLISDSNVTVEGHDKRDLPIGDILASANSGATRGSVELFDDNLYGSSLVGELVITFHGEQTSENIDEELLMPNMSESHQLRGIAIDSVASPVVSISSTSDQSETVTVNCIGETSGSTQRTMQIKSHQELTVRPCSAQDPLDGSANPLQFDQAPTGKPQAVGILIQSSDPNAQIQVFGLSPILINGVIGFAPIAFHDPDDTVSNQTVYPGVPLGYASQLWGTYAAKLAVQNFTSAPRTVTIYQARTGSGQSTYKPLTSLNISPGSIQTIAIPKVDDGSGGMSSFQIETDGTPGDVDTQLWSEEQTTGQPILFASKDAQDDRNTGMHPWSALNGSDDDLILYNQTASSQSVQLKIGNRASLWTKTITLAPHETRRISPQDLAEQKVPDDSNKPFTLGLGEGEISWFTQMSGLVHGRLEHKDQQAHLVTSFQCAGYTVFCSINPISGPSSITVGQTATYYSGNAMSCVNNLAPNTCWGVQSGGMSVNWQWNGYGGPLSLQGSSTMSSLTVLGASAGTDTLSIAGIWNSCVFTQTQSVNVSPPQPSEMWFFTDGTVKASVCPTQAENAQERVIQYQVTNSFGAPTPGVNVKEDFSSDPPVSNCTTRYAPLPTGCSTIGAEGIFSDYISTLACSPPDAATCGWQIVPDHWELCNGQILGSPSYIATWQQIYVDGSAAAIKSGTPVPK